MTPRSRKYFQSKEWDKWEIDLNFFHCLPYQDLNGYEGLCEWSEEQNDCDDIEFEYDNLDI